MKKTILSGMFASLLMLSMSATAQDSPSKGWYVGVNYAFLEYDVSGNEFDTPVLVVTPGYQINPYFAIEGRIGIGVGEGEDDVTVGNTTVEVAVELENYYGIFARLGASVQNRAYPYAMLGYGKIGTAVNGATIGDIDDYAYGVGVNFGFTEQLSGKVEWMNYYDEEDAEITGFSLGLQYRF